ncbi:MAG TPA: branched-chain amino acid ABC transporter permease [Candidatus Binatia bacterium]|nr:branched-chain amino acid ABC transporter permease [Candidatus Binatia bacterium]
MKRAGLWGLVAVAGLALAIALPHLGVPSFYISLASQMWIYAIVAMSLDLLVGFTGLVNFSQAAFFGMGAYAAAIALTRYHIAGFGAQIGLGVLLAMITGAVFGIVALRSEGVGFIIITIALNEIVWGLAYQWVSMSGGDNGITGILRPPLATWDLSDNTSFYYVALGAYSIALALLVMLVRSPFGLVLRGVRDSPRRMRALGYNVWLFRYIAFIISAAFAGFAGVLFAWYNQFVGPVNLALDTSTQFLIIVILGGIGTLYGQLLGAGIVVFLSNGLSAVTHRWVLILGAVYVLIVMYAPDGLVGLGRRLAARARGRRAAAVPVESLIGEGADG